MKCTECSISKADIQTFPFQLLKGDYLKSWVIQPMYGYSYVHSLGLLPARAHNPFHDARLCYATVCARRLF